MAVAKVDTKSRWIGLAGDTPPTATEMGSEFYETDTGKHYVWNGAWVQYVNNGYFGSLFPIADNTYDLGSAALSWRQAHIETVVYATSVLGNWSPSADNTYTLGTTTLGWVGLHMPDTYITDDTGVVKFRNNANNADVGITALTGIFDQAGADTAILSFRSTGDVATGLTTGTNIVDVTTADYGVLSKFAAATGGLLVQALGENAAVTTNLLFESYGGQADTTKSTAGRALIEVYAAQHNGSNALAAVAADGNIFAIRGHTVNTVAIVDEDGDLWLKGGITTGGTTPVGYIQNLFAGNFSSDGASTWAAKTRFVGTLAGSVGDSTLIGVLLANAITTQTAAETCEIVAQLYLDEPSITKNVTTITTAATLYIANAPTEGATNAAIYVASGSIRVAGNATYIGSTATGANGMILINPKNAAASGLSGTQLDVEIDIGGTPYYFTVYPTKA